MTERVKEASLLIKEAQIENVRQVRGTFRAGIRRAADAGKVDFILDYSGKSGARDESGFYSSVTFALKIADEAEGKRALVEVKATYEIRYSLREEVKATRKQLSAFSQINAVFNAWPYFREFLQGSFQRMDLPTPTLPLFRLKDMLQPLKQETNSSG